MITVYRLLSAGALLHLASGGGFTTQMAHPLRQVACTAAVCDPYGDLPVFVGEGVKCNGQCDPDECCAKEECTEQLGVCDDYYPVYVGDGVVCEGKCDANECCDQLECPEAVVLKPKLMPQGICRADGTKFEITGIEGVPMGFYVHAVNIVGGTAPIMEDSEGVMSVVLTPNEAVDVEVTLASTSSGPCGPFPAVRVTPMCGCETPEDCDTSNTGLICCEKTDVCDYFNTGACGDPHMTGFLGQKFDFTGEDGQWYSLIADENMNVNMRVTSPVADLPEITYITGLSVLTADADNYDHSIVIEAKDPHNLKSSCPAGVSPCLADGSLRVVLDGEEALQSPGTVILGQDVQVSAVNLPGACRSFGFEKYWDRKRLESARHGRRLGEALRMSEWVLDDPTATNMDECSEYVASAELAEGGGGMFAHQSDHASFQIVTPKATIRLSHGRLHQIAMRDPTDQFDFPDHLTWQMNMAVDHNEVSRDAKGILGETWVPTRGSDGEPIMTGLEAIRGQQEDYLVDGALGTDFIQG